jgi:hypothetical protein
VKARSARLVMGVIFLGAPMRTLFGAVTTAEVQMQLPPNSSQSPTLASVPASQMSDAMSLAQPVVLFNNVLDAFIDVLWLRPQ